jgi:hypothetical protein
MAQGLFFLVSENPWHTISTGGLPMRRKKYRRITNNDQAFDLVTMNRVQLQHALTMDAQDQPPISSCIVLPFARDQRRN